MMNRLPKTEKLVINIRGGAIYSDTSSLCLRIRTFSVLTMIAIF